MVIPKFVDIATYPFALEFRSASEAGSIAVMKIVASKNSGTTFLGRVYIAQSKKNTAAVSKKRGCTKQLNDNRAAADAEFTEINFLFFDSVDQSDAAP
jgi:hypothetical protein